MRTRASFAQLEVLATRIRQNSGECASAQREDESSLARFFRSLLTVHAPLSGRSFHEKRQVGASHRYSVSPPGPRALLRNPFESLSFSPSALFAIPRAFFSWKEVRDKFVQPGRRS